MESDIITACETFSKGDAFSISSYIDDEVVWEIIGDKTIQGKDDLLEFCKELNTFDDCEFENIKTTVGLGQIVVEGFDKKSKNVFYCDSYTIKDKKIISIHSYCICNDCVK